MGKDFNVFDFPHVYIPEASKVSQFIIGCQKWVTYEDRVRVEKLIRKAIKVRLETIKKEDEEYMSVSFTIPTSSIPKEFIHPLCCYLSHLGYKSIFARFERLSFSCGN